VQLLHAFILGSERGYCCQSVCDVTSKMSADEELQLLSAAAVDFIGSIQLQLSFNGKHDYVTSKSTQVLCHVSPPNVVNGCNTFASIIAHETMALA